MADLYGMDEALFRAMAVSSVVKYWNSNEDLIKQYGQISHEDVYITWQCKAIENFKALLGVSRDGDGMYFEITYHGAKHQFYLDVYHKETQVIVPMVDA